MRRDPDHRVLDRPHGRAAGLQQAGVAVQAADEPALAGRRRESAEPRMGVEYGQEGQSDSRDLRRRRQGLRHFRRIGEGRTVEVVVQIMELTHPHEAGLQHFRERERCDGLQVIGPEPLGQPVHPRAPGPEVVAVLAPKLRRSGHGPLEGVAVQVRQAGQAQAVPLVAGPA